jgi:hypothetical protein
MRKLLKFPLLGLAYLAVTTDVYADVSFHGFGQVIMGTTFSNNRTVPSNIGADYHADPTFTPNSNFGLQASAPLSENISATAQILARGEQDFQPKFQWAYLKYQFNDTYALKVGRLQLPFYQYSDFQFVGEAYPWVLPPEAVYNAASTFYDGLNFSAQKSVGDWFFYLQAIYGNSQFTASSTVGSSQVNVSATNKNLTGFALEGDYDDWLNLRAAAFYNQTSVTGDGSFALIDQIAAGLNQDAAKALVASNDPGVYYTASAQITRNNWLLLTEFRGFQPIAGASGIAGAEIASEYITVGYRFGKLLPVLTFGHENEQLRANKMIDAGVPAFIVNSLTEAPNIRLKDYYYQAGVRYDLTATVALKLDYTYYQSHWKSSDYTTSGVTTDPPFANRLLAAITFSF